jgi:tRNA threonylcarbamoyladenosine biosynthesis protein TsaB
LIYILHIETSGAVCSVCLSANGEAIAEKENATVNAHAKMLTLLVEDLMTEKQLSLTELNAVAVSIGPGSYTGLRIGVSAAKGFCYALNIPLIAVSTLQSIARCALSQTKNENSNYLTTIDARRNEVYMAVFDHSAIDISPVVPRIVDADLIHSLNNYKSLTICGNGAFKFKDWLTENKSWRIVENTETHARYMVQTSYSKFLASDFSDVAYTEPLYLKEFTGAKAATK